MNSGNTKKRPAPPSSAKPPPQKHHATVTVDEEDMIDEDVFLDETLLYEEEALVLRDMEARELLLRASRSGSVRRCRKRTCHSLQTSAREAHLELLRQQGFQQAIGGGQATTSNANAEDSYDKFVHQNLKMFSARSDLKYDICGWIILVVGIVSWVGMPKSNVPPVPPPR